MLILKKFVRHLTQISKQLSITQKENILYLPLAKRGAENFNQFLGLLELLPIEPSLKILTKENKNDTILC